MKCTVEFVPNFIKDFPYQAFRKDSFWSEWKHIGNFESLESARAVCDAMVNNPVYEVNK